MRNKYKQIISVLVLLIVCSISMGYAAFGSELSISNIVADVRIASDVRVTGVSFVSSENGSVTNLDYDADSVIGNINLKASTSTVTLQVKVTNFGNTEMGIYNISGLSDNLMKQISGYTLQDKLCDSTGKCSLGSTTTFNITIGYDTYDAVTKDHDIRLDFEFRKMHNVTYTGITNNNYPTSVIDGGNLKFTATSNIPPKIIAFNSTGDRYNYNLYSYVNGVFTFNNVTSDINLKYQEKAYMAVMADNTYYKESAYKTKIDSVQFVDYVDTSNAVKVYDLSEVSGSKDVIGWITSGNDLYIGSEWNIYSKDLDSTFHGMSGILTISFGNLNTSECTNMHYMFKDCSELTSLDVSSFDTSNVTNMGRMFQNVSKITNLDLSNFNTSKVLIMRGIFKDCRSLTNIDVSSFNTSSVTNMDEMFSDMSNLLSLDLSNFNTSKVTGMSSMFYNCGNLVSLNISSFNTFNVTNMSYMFSGIALSSLDLSHFNTGKVTTMAYMFCNLSALTSLDLSHFDTSNVVSFSGMFFGSSLLKNLNLGSFNTKRATDMSSMFRACTSLTTLDVSNFDTSNVVNMSNMFRRFPGTSLDLSNFNTSKVTDMSGIFSLAGNVKEIKVSNLWVIGGTTNISSMFEDCGVSNVTYI